MKKMFLFWVIFFVMIALSISIEPTSRLGFAASSLIDPQAFSQPATSCSGDNSCSGGQGGTSSPPSITPDTTITSTPPNPSNSGDATFTFTCDAGSCTYDCLIDSGSWTPCTSPQTYTGLVSNGHTFQVRAWDGSGNVDPTPASYSWVVSFDSWTATSISPSARSWSSAVWTGSVMIIWGGYNASTYYNTGGVYDPATNSWTATSTGTNVPSARAGHSAVWTGSEMIVWGGTYNSIYYTLRSGGRYNPATNSWTATSTGANVPSPRAGHSAVWTGSEMIIWGGYDGSTPCNTGGRYNPAADSWTATSTGANVPSARAAHSAVWTGSEMIVWGGSDGSFSFNDGSKYNPASDTWIATSTGANVPPARGAHSAVWTGSEMIVWGGSNGSSLLNSGGKYNPSSDTWTATSTGANVPAARCAHSTVWTGSEMIVWGGNNGVSEINTGGRYDPAADSWTATSTGANVPSVREFHTAVWTGSEMIVWGGDIGEFLSTGSRYDPSTNSWTATGAGANVPSARYYHTAVWTGSEMIIWGGFDIFFSTFAGTVGTGGRYDPATDSWTATGTGANVPAARYYHTAVWTGSEMIVWGGYNIISHFLNTGGRYNPATDSWTATSTGANVPSARHYHTAVWADSVMIIWGGYNGSCWNTGGKYDPATDSWTTTSTGANVPAARKYHTAVWTGSVMIVWGGYNDNLSPSEFLNTGGRYDPAADTWTATAISPSARYGHSAVWTGLVMIIWGGLVVDINPLTNTGSRYDPVANSWSATSTGTNVPSARAGHTAVWTGAKMIIWGGLNISSLPINTGGVYDPSANSWTATSTGANVPSARIGYSAVWAGSKMIIWGGNKPSFTNTGGRYRP